MTYLNEIYRNKSQIMTNMANAVSILTDEKYFDGSFERLQALTTKQHYPYYAKTLL